MSEPGGPGKDTTRGAVILLGCLFLFPFAFAILSDLVAYLVNN